MEDTESLSIPGYEKDFDVFSWIKPYVRQCGNAPRHPWNITGRKLLDYLIVYIEKGYGKMIIDGVEYRADEKDLFWVPPNVPHYMEGSSPVMICPFVHFDIIYRYPESHWDFTIPGGMTNLDDFKFLMHPAIPDSPFSRLKGKYQLFNNERIGNKINEICITAVNARPHFHLDLNGKMVECLSELLRGIESDVHSGFPHLPEIEQASEYIQRNIREKLSVRGVAEILGFSESHFRKIFKEIYGVPPGDYIRTNRIEHAKELMMYSGFTFSEIAESCGFESIHSFSKAFKKHQGVSPREYRLFGKATTRVEGRKKEYPG